MRCKHFIDRCAKSTLRRFATTDVIASKLSEGVPIEQILTSSVALEQLWQTMPETDKTTLTLIIKRFGSEPFDWSRLNKLAGYEITGAELKVGLTRLRLSGIVFTLRKSWGEYLYMIPVDTYPIWIRLTLPQFIGTYMNESEVETTDEASSGLSAAIFYFISACHKEGLPFTQRGTVHKRNIQKIMEYVPLNDETLASFHLQYDHADVYPVCFAVLLDIALRLDLLSTDQHNMIVQSDEVLRWLSQSIEQMNQKLLSIWTDEYQFPAIHLRHIAASIQHLPYGVWFSVDDAAHWLQQCDIVDTDQVRQVKNDIVHALIKPFAHFGWFEIGRIDHTTLFRRILRLPEDNAPSNVWDDEYKAFESFYIQPDFEIIVPPTVRFFTRWHLESMSKRVQTDRVVIYKISKESVQEAVHSGRSTDDILMFLREHSLYGVPDNVEMTIRQWGGPQRKFEVRTQLALDSADTAAEHISAAQKSDYIVHSTFSAQHYEVETELPDIEQIYPMLRTIPPMWLKEMRAYHSSTRKEMIERAIEWKTYIKIKQNDIETVVIPHTLTENKGRWEMIGWTERKQIHIAPDQWEQMQLILPGINDK